MKGRYSTLTAFLLHFALFVYTNQKDSAMKKLRKEAQFYNFIKNILDMATFDIVWEYQETYLVCFSWSSVAE